MIKQVLCKNLIMIYPVVDRQTLPWKVYLFGGYWNVEARKKVRAGKRGPNAISGNIHDSRVWYSSPTRRCTVTAICCFRSQNQVVSSLRFPGPLLLAGTCLKRRRYAYRNVPMADDVPLHIRRSHRKHVLSTILAHDVDTNFPLGTHSQAHSRYRLSSD